MGHAGREGNIDHRSRLMDYNLWSSMSAAGSIKIAPNFDYQCGCLLKTPPLRWPSPYDTHASHKIRRIKIVDAYHERGRFSCITITMRIPSWRAIVRGAEPHLFRVQRGPHPRLSAMLQPPSELASLSPARHQSLHDKRACPFLA